MAIYVLIPGIEGDCHVEPYATPGKRYFVADSFSFGVTRELAESGGKGGTADINIGVGELQECSISKSMDSASAYLAQAAISGNSVGTAEVDFVQTIRGGSGTKALPYLKYKLETCFVKSWSTSGDADDRPTEDVTFWYNRISIAYQPFDGKKFGKKFTMTWDQVKNTEWAPPGSDIAFPAL